MTHTHELIRMTWLPYHDNFIYKSNTRFYANFDKHRGLFSKPQNHKIVKSCESLSLNLNAKSFNKNINMMCSYSLQSSILVFDMHVFMIECLFMKCMNVMLRILISM